MKIIGIVTEYNPFHNGHLYQINKIKEIYPDSLIAIVVNGYVTERGELSFLTKEDKTKIALSNGVDIVLELPALFGCQSADTFANKSIEILNNIKIDTLVFGSESNKISILKKIAKKQIDSDLKIKEYLDEGLNYPTALKKALDIDFDYNNPNDLLAISYIKSIIENNYNINYESIKRTTNYHDLNSNDEIISASNIRNKFINNENVSSYVPYDVNKYHLNNNQNKLFELLKYKITNENNLQSYLTVDEGIDNKLKKEIINSNNIDELIKNVKSKRYTYNRIQRMLLHILLGIKKEDAQLDLNYIRVLGFSKEGQKYLNTIKKDLELPIYSNKVKSTIKDYELKTSLIYDLINNTKTYNYEIKNKPIIK